MATPRITPIIPARAVRATKAVAGWRRLQAWEAWRRVDAGRCRSSLPAFAGTRPSREPGVAGLGPAAIPAGRSKGCAGVDVRIRGLLRVTDPRSADSARSETNGWDTSRLRRCAATAADACTGCGAFSRSIPALLGGSYRCRAAEQVRRTRTMGRQPLIRR